MTAYQEFRKRQKALQVEGGTLAYTDEGEGEPILLVHGVPTSSWLYRKVSSYLLEAGFRVIVPDLLGYGSSSKPKSYDLYHEFRQGQRLLNLMEHLGIGSWNHVMHDVGGLWSWEMMKQHAQGVKRLIILNTLIYEAGFDPPLRFEPGLKARAYTQLYKWPVTAKGLIQATFNNGMVDCDLTKQEFEGYTRPMREGGNRALYYFFTQTCKGIPPYQDVLKSLDIPVRVIWGAEDPMLKWQPMSQAVSEDLGISQEDIFILPDHKHFIQEESPEDVARLIATFIQ